MAEVKDSDLENQMERIFDAISEIEQVKRRIANRRIKEIKMEEERRARFEKEVE